MLYEYLLEQLGDALYDTCEVVCSDDQRAFECIYYYKTDPEWKKNLKYDILSRMKTCDIANKEDQNRILRTLISHGDYDTFLYVINTDHIKQKLNLTCKSLIKLLPNLAKLYHPQHPGYTKDSIFISVFCDLCVKEDPNLFSLNTEEVKQFFEQVCTENDYNCLKYFKGQDINVTFSTGYTPLFWALCSGRRHIRFLRELVEFGIDVHKSMLDAEFLKKIQEAQYPCYRPHQNAILFLIGRGCKIDEKMLDMSLSKTQQIVLQYESMVKDEIKLYNEELTRVKDSDIIEITDMLGHCVEMSELGEMKKNVTELLAKVQYLTEMLLQNSVK